MTRLSRKMRSSSQDQVRGLIRGSNFHLAGKEEFDRLREIMAEVKSMFMETKKEILGLKQILNAQHVDHEDDHTSSDHVNPHMNMDHLLLEMSHSVKLRNIVKKKMRITFKKRCFRG